MDFEEKKKRQKIRVIIAEIGMVLAVIAIVVVSTLAAMGFMISANGGIEQQGLMQLHSAPTGATVTIDGSTVFARTNLSRTLMPGVHSLELTREGYDTWRKEIIVRSGMLLRIYYPRLFLQNRSQEVVQTLTQEKKLEFYAPSDSHNYILYAEKLAPEWQLVDIRGDEVRTTLLDLSGILPGMVAKAHDEKTNNNVKNQAEAGQIKTNNIVTPEYEFQGRIDEIKWSSNDENVLVKVTYDNKTQWVLVRLHDVASSINITETFGLGETKLEMIDGAASRLYALERNQLRRINAIDGVMSKVLLNDVMDFVNDGTDIVYLTRVQDKQYVGTYRDEEKGGVQLAEYTKDKQVKIGLANYYGDSYIAYIVDNVVTVKYGRFPTYNDAGGDASGLEVLIESAEMSEMPDKFVVSPDSAYLIASKGLKVMAIDLEMSSLFEYDAPDNSWQWLEAGMIYAVKDQDILVWDFDGTNQRNLSTAHNQVIDAAVTITANGRWMYYLSDKDGTQLVRERIRD